MNYFQIRLFAAFLGYIIYDLTLMAIFKEGMLTPGTQEFEQFIHHMFCIYGSAAGLICGRYLGVLMSASLLTEISTPCLNIYELLNVHKAVDTTLYKANAYLFFLTFFFGRIVFQFYLIAMLLIPGTIQIDMSYDGVLMSGYTYFSAAIYPWLYFLNLFWFHKMVKAALLFLDTGDASEKSAKTPQEHSNFSEEDKQPLITQGESVVTV